MVKQAVKPNYFLPFEEIQEDEKEKTIEDDLREEQMLHGMSNHEGWHILKKYIERQIDNLEGFNKSQMEKGMSFEEIGRNAVVIELCKGELNRIINKVEDAKEAIEKQNAKDA